MHKFIDEEKLITFDSVKCSGYVKHKFYLRSIFINDFQNIDIKIDHKMILVSYSIKILTYSYQTITED